MARASRLAFVALLAAAGVYAGYATSVLDREPAPAVARGGELTVSLRSEPKGYIRYNDSSAASEQLSLLLDARLVQINRVTDTVEPALAERWTASPDGLTYTLTLRQDVRFSDGAPFTADDVLFTARVLYDERLAGGLGEATKVGGRPLVFEAPDPHTVVVRLPSRFAPGIRLLAHVPILPRHALEPAFAAGELGKTWLAGTSPSEVVGLGPFVLAGHAAGQHLRLTRNPHYWRTDEDGVPLPYVDEVTLAMVPDQNAEALRLESGATDLMSTADIRPDDYASFARARDAGRLRLEEVGVGLDANALWFNLTDRLREDAPWIRERAFRQAISHAVDRQAIVDTVYLGAAVPVYGPVTPGNRTWYSAGVPQQPHDPARARALLASIGLQDRDGDGTLEDDRGRPVRFSILTQAGQTIRERTVTMIQEHLRAVGIAVDVVRLEPGALFSQFAGGTYDAMYHGLSSTATDPALNLQFWLSSGNFHVWHPGQAAPATAWEARIDELMHRQAAAETLAERQQLFAEAQRILAEELPAIYFAAPKVFVAMGTRVQNVRPVVQMPQVLWQPDTLAVSRN